MSAQRIVPFLGERAFGLQDPEGHRWMLGGRL
jgi:uncharacterized glyoxalase superfamily protein PhnB